MFTNSELRRLRTLLASRIIAVEQEIKRESYPNVNRLYEKELNDLKSALDKIISMRLG